MCWFNGLNGEHDLFIIQSFLKWQEAQKSRPGETCPFDDLALSGIYIIL